MKIKMLALIVSLLSLGLVSQQAHAQYNTVNVLDATYGQNCGAWYGNVTSEVRQSCNNQNQCQYYVNVQRIGDPAPGCSKDFVVHYQCGYGSQTQTASVFAEANGKIVNLNCSTNYGYGISVTNATFGGNVGAAYGNVTSSVQAQCENQRQCNVYISTNVFGDPVPGRDKSFDVQWRCPNGQRYSQTIPANAQGRYAYLTCQ
jgi:hypothetical protein